MKPVDKVTNSRGEVHFFQKKLIRAMNASLVAVNEHRYTQFEH